MSDDVTPQTEAPAAPEPTAQEPDQGGEHSYTERTVPYGRFAEVNKQAKAAKEQLTTLSQRLEELEGRDQSELQKERQKRERFEREASELAARVTTIERQGWLREAARDLKFDDPDDATAFIDTKDVDDPDDAVQAVKDLAKRKPRLLKTEPPESKIGQVMQNGQQVRPQAQQAQQSQGLDPQAADFLAQLEHAKRATGWQSLPLGGSA
jgi:hypothetical protein